MSRVEMFVPEDLLLLDPQLPQLREMEAGQKLAHGWELKEAGSAFTVWEQREHGPLPVLCGGAVRLGKHYARLWGLFSRHKPRVPLFLTRGVARFVAQLPEARVEAQVAASNAGACGWMRLIGLEEEARLRAAMPDRSDMVLFVRRGLLDQGGLR